jgi:hypothetical protein
VRSIMGKRTILALAVLAIIVSVLQWTPLAFLPEDAADFIAGLAAGLAIGALVAWFAGRSGE